MTGPELKITCRLEEVTVIGKFLTDAALADQAAFTTFSTIFTPAYFTDATTKMNAIEALITPKLILAEQKVITNRMLKNMILLKSKIDFIEFYIKKATLLTIDAKDFGVKEVRAANNKGDVEALVDALVFLLKNATNNMAALVAKGYTPAQHTDLTTLKTSFFNDNAAQNAKMNERNNKVIANYGLINEYWAICIEIGDAGKRIFKRSASNKVDDFTIAELKRRIRQEQKRNKFTGVIKLDGKGVYKANVELIPVAGGRRRVTKTDANGKFVIKSLTEGEYLGVVSGVGIETQSISVVIATGKTTTQDYTMEEAENDTVNKPK